MEGTFIYSYIQSFCHFWGFKLLNFNIFFYVLIFFSWGGGGQKINILGDRKSLWIFLGIIRKQGYFGGYLYAIMVKVLQNGIIFFRGGVLKFRTFLKYISQRFLIFWG